MIMASKLLLGDLSHSCRASEQLLAFQGDNESHNRLLICEHRALDYIVGGMHKAITFSLLHYNRPNPSLKHRSLHNIFASSVWQDGCTANFFFTVESCFVYTPNKLVFFG
ncbi:hypothetical protein Tco_0496552 [Tanacetum coccineum]